MTVPPVGEIPTSDALSIPQDSIQELYSRDPESYTKQDLDSIITEIRQHRERLAATTGPVKATKAVKAPTNVTAADLGF